MSTSPDDLDALLARMTSASEEGHLCCSRLELARDVIRKGYYVLQVKHVPWDMHIARCQAPDEPVAFKVRS